MLSWVGIINVIGEKEGIAVKDVEKATKEIGDKLVSLLT